ncbi:hypothetical protein [Xenorhabdus nematophila]|uniref:hypothetical protein n=1 Tax=Xenorhabdus nematophila TaxID=628 RepID=UPI0039898966
MQSNIITIPKSMTPSRIVENFNVFDCSLTEEERKRINTLDCHKRVGTNPDKYDCV